MVGECPISDLSNQKWRRKSSVAMYYVVYEKKQHFDVIGEQRSSRYILKIIEIVWQLGREN
jgi:hypothetical protein